jgi:hypothetical protein
MLNIKRATIALAFAGLSTAALFSPAQAAGRTGTTADYGQAVNTGAVDRVINLDAGTQYVNVTNGETVQFNLNGQAAFTWHFDTFSNETSFELSKIAPATAGVEGVRVYVASNPLYRG